MIQMMLTDQSPCSYSDDNRIVVERLTGLLQGSPTTILVLSSSGPTYYISAVTEGKECRSTCFSKVVQQNTSQLTTFLSLRDAGIEETTRWLETALCISS